MTDELLIPEDAVSKMEVAASDYRDKKRIKRIEQEFVNSLKRGLHRMRTWPEKADKATVIMVLGYIGTVRDACKREYMARDDVYRHFERSWMAILERMHEDIRKAVWPGQLDFLFYEEWIVKHEKTINQLETEGQTKRERSCKENEGMDGSGI